jgi:hypothetical protein
MNKNCATLTQDRPYLNNFDATGSPCHELTSWDNSSSMSIWLGRKESQCEDILPVSSTDGAASSPTISLAQGEKKESTPFLPESKYELSIRGLAQLVDEKSN